MTLDIAYFRATGIRPVTDQSGESIPSKPLTIAGQVMRSYENVEAKSVNWLISLCKSSLGLAYRSTEIRVRHIIFFFEDNSFVLIAGVGGQAGMHPDETWKTMETLHRVHVRL